MGFFAVVVFFLFFTSDFANGHRCRSAAKQISFSLELFSTDLTSRFAPMSRSPVARSLFSIDIMKSLNNFSTASVFGVGFSTAVLLIICLHSVSKIQSEVLVQ